MENNLTIRNDCLVKLQKVEKPRPSNYVSSFAFTERRVAAEATHFNAAVPRCAYTGGGKQSQVLLPLNQITLDDHNQQHISILSAPGPSYRRREYLKTSH